MAFGYNNILGQSISRAGIGFQTMGKQPGIYTNLKDSGILFMSFHQGICKGIITQTQFFPLGKGETIKKENQSIVKPKFLEIHGNVSYDFTYRSRIDTPINMTGLQQHTERVYLRGLIREKYPFKIGFTSRQSNSPYFKNFLDMNYQFDPYTFRRNLKEELLNRINTKLLAQPYLDSIENVINEKKRELSKYKGWLESSSTLQKIIEEKERKHNAARPSKTIYPNLDDPLKNIKWNKYFVFMPANENTTVKNSQVENFEKVYEEKKSRMQLLTDSIKTLEAKSDSIKTSIREEMANVKQKIYGAVSQKDLSDIARQNDIQPGKTGKLERRLAAVKSFSIGRTLLDYTELTAKNITITGVNVEYNPSYYAAIAAGKISYRFRDFFNKSSAGFDQYITLGRIGVGDIEKKALILTVFQGRKSQSLYPSADSVNNHINVLGYSLEAIFRKNKNTGLNIEIAKSTRPVTGSFVSNKEIGSLWQFGDKSNMGINLKAETVVPESDTKISGFFRKTGEYFQSFSLFSYNTDQTAWLARIDQPLLKRKVTVTGMLRQNDFTNPFTDKTFKTTTVFKTFIVNVRVPKYPAISFGYYPGTQFYLVDKEKIRENAYYILNGSLVYSYYYKGTGMNTSLVFNRYFNKATDSGFVMYKGINYYASQSVFFKKFQLQGGYAFTKQTELRYYTLEAAGDYAIMDFLKIGGGIKYNKTGSGSEYWGEKAQLTIDFKKLGGLQFQYDKSYLPSLNQTLYPIETGRVSWYKYF